MRHATRCPFQRWDREGTFRGYCRLAWAHDGPHDVDIKPITLQTVLDIVAAVQPQYDAGLHPVEVGK